MKLYTTPPSILTFVTWVQRTQAWPLANSACRLAIGQTESYSVQPCLLLAATISPVGQSRVFFYKVWPASLMVGPDFTAPTLITFFSAFLDEFTFLSTFLSSVTFFSPFFNTFLRLSVQRNLYGSCTYTLSTAPHTFIPNVPLLSLHTAHSPTLAGLGLKMVVALYLIWGQSQDT